MRQYRIVLMGSGGVGKTSLTTQFVSRIFESRYEPTIEELSLKTMEIDGELCSLELLDTAGVDQYSQMRDVHIAEGQCFILIYSVANKNTFTDVQMLREEIFKIKRESVPIILVGNKRDLSKMREVETKDGEELSERWPLCTFHETSATCNQDAEEIFKDAVRQTNRYEEHKPYQKKILSEKLSFKRRLSKGQCVVM